MQKLWILQVFVISALTTGLCSAQTPSQLLGGTDLYLNANTVGTSKSGAGENLAFFHGDFSLVVGNSTYKSDQALVIIEPITTDYLGKTYTVYRTKVYLEGNIQKPGPKHVPKVDIFFESAYQGTGLALTFDVTGQVYATAAEHKSENISALPIYGKAVQILDKMEKQKLLTVIQPDAQVPKIERIISPDKVAIKQPEKKPGPAPAKAPDQPAPQPLEGPEIKYPVNIASATSEKVIFDSQKLQTDDGLTAVVVTGRFYLWQQISQGVNLLEMAADNAVIYYASDQVKIGSQQTGQESIDASGPIHSIYLTGNVVMTEGSRTITASQLYYDFNTQQGLAVDSAIKTYDPSRDIPVYIRADKMRQIAQNRFTAEDVTIASSEFADPQLKLTASTIALTDTTPEDIAQGELDDSSYMLEMEDIRLKYHDTTLFYWPKVVTDFERPDTPLKTVSISDDSDFGFSVETQWYLHRLLGLKRPEGVKATLAVDAYSERGIGTGIKYDYTADDYFGSILGYIIDDSGEDDLGRTRRNIDPEQSLRGRFRMLHRHYLPHDWQLTFETSYYSDRNFIESFYRNEFNTGKAQENILELKRIWDNQALSILGKIRINDFVNELEELPTVQYHLTGESVFDDRFTFFNDSQISRYRQRYDDDSPAAADPTLSEQFYTFAYSRSELDLPLIYHRTNFVPYIAATVGYEDLDGFNAPLNGTADRGSYDTIIGEAGLRISKKFWAVNENIRSSFWNVNGIRHIVNPHAEFAFFSESDDYSEQRDTMNFGLEQRWQTKRLISDQYQSVDWMRLSIDATFVTDDQDDLTAPDHFIWNRPFQPLPFRRDTDSYGIRRDMINAEYQWHVTDTTSILSDLNYDIDDSSVGQFNIGLSHYRYPDLSYYIGSRYLKNVEILDQEGSHALLYALTYNLNPRYTLVFSQEYNFEYGSSIDSEITFIRRYNKINWAITLTNDSTLDRSGILFSIWPEGIKEFAVGSRKYYGLTGTTSQY